MNIFGEDILLDKDLYPMIAANGMPLTTSGVLTVLQDIKLRLIIPKGNLFYDKEFGSSLHLYIYDESDESTKLMLINEIIRTIRKDSRVKINSVQCTISQWNDQTGEIILSASFHLYESSEAFHMMISIDDKKGIEVIINDVTN